MLTLSITFYFDIRDYLPFAISVINKLSNAKNMNFQMYEW